MSVPASVCWPRIHRPSRRARRHAAVALHAQAAALAITNEAEGSCVCTKTAGRSPPYHSTGFSIAAGVVLKFIYSEKATKLCESSTLLLFYGITTYVKPSLTISVFIENRIYSEKATTFCKISTLLLSYVVPVKSKVEISQNFMAFSEYVNFSIYSYRQPCFTT